MLGETNQRDRLVLAIIAGVVGILCFTVVPYLIVGAMDAVLKGAAVKIPASGNPLIRTAPQIVITFFPFWGGLSMAAGIALLLIAFPLYKGEKWSRPAAIGLLAIPSITGAYLSGPVMFFGQSAVRNFVTVLSIGLIGYFAMLLWGKGDWRNKIGDFALFLLLGVTAAWSFSNGGSSLRMFWARPDQNMVDGAQYGFVMGTPTVWIGVAMVIISIPLLAGRTRWGWRLALTGLLTILLGNATLFITHLTTMEFLYGILMAIGSLVLLVIPFVGGRWAHSPTAQQTTI